MSDRLLRDAAGDLLCIKETSLLQTCRQPVYTFRVDVFIGCTGAQVPWSRRILLSLYNFTSTLLLSTLLFFHSDVYKILVLYLVL
jgi:hypothetical protein